MITDRWKVYFLKQLEDIKMIARGLSILLLITIPTHIIAYKSGAPETVCDSMIPDHHSTPKTTPSPYTISVSKNSIKAGESVQVTLAGAKNTQFKGYFIQARVGNTPIGKFDKGAEINLVNCGGGVATAATHTDNNDKGKITLTWTAPDGLSESVKFRVTFVQTGADYWVGQESEPITVK
ncbi:putative defense protein Hdd11 isoform X2 [Periplaneta americana]|uniref:putative defense protein Hdd11 isoform X2 n=1 Tax=Periplaneta americana TaxID=6978 RepID=UPI0037E78204